LVAEHSSALQKQSRPLRHNARPFFSGRPRLRGPLESSMSSLRSFLVVSLIAVSYLLFLRYQEFTAPKLPPPAANSEVAAPAAAASDPAAPTAPSDVPQAAAPPADLPVAATAAATPRGDSIRVRTDLLDVRIETTGGDLSSAKLLRYPIKPKQYDQPVELLKLDPDAVYLAQSGLFSQSGVPAPNHTTAWTLAPGTPRELNLADGQNELSVALEWTDPSGLSARKIYTFRRGSYEVALRHELGNQSGTPWVVGEYRQLQRTPAPASDHAFTSAERYSYVGASIYSPEDKFQKVKFEEMADEPLNRSITGGWMAMMQHYFIAAWIPPAGQANLYDSMVLDRETPLRFRIRQTGPTQTIEPGATAALDSRLFIGPKLQDVLPAVAPGLEHTVDYGIFTLISEPLFWLMNLIYGWLGNWGVAIILITLLVKAAFYKLTEAQYKSSAKMRKLQPKIQALSEKFGQDRQKLAEAQMDLFKKEKVNPLGGCLPILVQIPIFMGLYWVLLESVEMRQAPFAFWIQDLSARDPYFVLPILNGLAMFASSKLTPMPAGMDPLQAKIMMYMPVMMSVMFAFFPAGLVLYWTVNSSLSLLQQWYITRKIERMDARDLAKV
jgi:YidC/Oxa1 family membrane protein insertase